MKIIIRILNISLLAVGLFVKTAAQTNVSGGIYANTTWTQASSPYIVTDTIVVFPGVTLTIQPGVTVKFADHTRIEFRQARLLALGTSADSIIFTSNSSTPAAGIHSCIYLNGGNMSSRFSFCRFSYAATALYATTTDSLTLHCCQFNQSVNGAEYIGANTTEIGLADSCVFSNITGTALYLEYLSYANISTCTFLSNGIGFNGSHGPPNSNIYHYFMKDCIFRLNQTALQPGRMHVSNCTLSNNASGIDGQGRSTIRNCIIDSNTIVGINTYADTVANCIIQFNAVGVKTFESYVAGNWIEYSTGANVTDNGSSLSTITGNTIRYGYVGVNAITSGTLIITKNYITDNNTGINLNNSICTISCNHICNNAVYALHYTSANNVNVSHNTWCTQDSASTEPLIYDGMDNISYGLARILPFDSACSPATGIGETTLNTFTAYPNPSFGEITVTGAFEITSLQVIDIVGQVIHSEAIDRRSANIHIGSPGIYFILIRSGGTTLTKKVIVTDR